MTIDDILNRLGGYGRFQVLLYLALGCVNMRGAWHVFVTIFVAWTPGHHCTPYANRTLNESLPLVETDETLDYSPCLMYAQSGEGGHLLTNRTVGCQNGWTYAWENERETSVTSEWDLVCDKEYLVQLTTTLYMVGALCGTLFLTPLSDLCGRKPVILACLWLQAAVGIALAWMPSEVPYIALQFLIGITNMTIALCSYVLIVETFSGRTRELPAISLQFFWSGGIMVLSLLAFLLPEWRYLQMTISLPQCLTILFIWLLPESLTWLLIKGKTEQAKAVILRIIRVNKLPAMEDLDKVLAEFTESKVALDAPVADSDKFQSTEELVSSQATSHGASYTVLDMFKTPRLRMFSLFMFYLYLVNSLAYFGTQFSMPSLNGNKYLNIFISGAVEVPAHLLCIICNRRVGRRIPMCVFLVVCAVANAAVIFTPGETGDGTNLSGLKTTLVMIGKFGITGSYSALYLYGTEIFPTSIRNHAVGLCSFFENIGSIAAPQIVYAAQALSYLPMTVFAVMTLVGAVVVLFLPETHNSPLPQTVEDVENWGKKKVLTADQSTKF